MTHRYEEEQERQFALKDRNNNAEHFGWIKDLSCLVSSQINKKKNKKYFCNRYIYI